MSEHIYISKFLPDGTTILLTGGGRQFIEHIGEDAAREVVAGVLTGRNIRDQTEPLTRRRISQVTGGLVAMFAHAKSQIPDLEAHLSELALKQLESNSPLKRTAKWPAQWVIGLTEKGYQNVLRRSPPNRKAYIDSFEAAITAAAQKCRDDLGDLRMTLGFVKGPDGRVVELDWNGISRLTTAIGCATLTLRGSEKSMYGKLFERLVLGSILSILGYKRVNPRGNTANSMVFWLGDASGNRECDATVIHKPGKVARFDIGFIGSGNPEISKDKLSRYEGEIKRGTKDYSSKTFIIVDRLPASAKTQKAAEKSGAIIVQMSMQYWPRALAKHLSEWFDSDYELSHLDDAHIEKYLRARLNDVPITEFLINVDVDESNIEDFSED